MLGYLVAATAFTVVRGALRRDPTKEAALLTFKSKMARRAALKSVSTQLPNDVPDGTEGVLPSDFFTHDAEKRAELNPYPKLVPKGCHPKCSWTCDPGCDEVCTPVCKPPNCKTECARLDVKSCDRHCEPPKCVVVCPTVQCEHEECPKCKTVCAAPVCTTDCPENCDSFCAHPKCSWHCKPSASCPPQPKCYLDCSHPHVCNLNSDVDARPTPPHSLIGDKIEPKSEALAYILPQPGDGGGPAPAPAPGQITAVSLQGPLFMPGPAAPTNVTNATIPEPEAEEEPRPQEPTMNLRNNDGKGGLNQPFRPGVAS